MAETMFPTVGYRKDAAPRRRHLGDVLVPFWPEAVSKTTRARPSVLLRSRVT